MRPSGRRRRIREDSVCAPAASAFTVSKRMAFRVFGNRGTGEGAVHFVHADGAGVDTVRQAIHPREAFLGVRELPALEPCGLDRDAQPLEQLQLVIAAWPAAGVRLRRPR